MIRHAVAAERLRRCPGRWLQVGPYGSRATAVGISLQIRSARLAAYEPAGSFDAEVQYIGGEPTVLARFLTPDQQVRMVELLVAAALPEPPHVAWSWDEGRACVAGACPGIAALLYAALVLEAKVPRLDDANGVWVADGRLEGRHVRLTAPVDEDALACFAPITDHAAPGRTR